MIKTRLKEAITHPDETLDLLWHRAFSLFGHDQYKRFIVLGRPRIGSNLLISFLNSHPNIYARREIFFRLNGRDYRQVLNRIFCKQPPNIKAVGFKIFYRQPYDDKNSGVWNDLIERQQVHVIHLKRRNILRALLSGKISHKTNIWQATKASHLQDIQGRKVEFSYEELATGFKAIRCLEDEFDDKFSSHPLLTISYEDLVSKSEAVFESITNFLELPFNSPKTRHIRLNPEKLSTLIVNYEGLKKEFSDTEWAHFFEEEEN
jgi:LPS sulfotransferase NodH